MHLERVRADSGGHSVAESVLRSIYESSISNLARAIREMDFVSVYDNGGWGVTPTVLLQTKTGDVIGMAAENAWPLTSIRPELRLPVFI